VMGHLPHTLSLCRCINLFPFPPSPQPLSPSCMADAELLPGCRNLWLSAPLPRSCSDKAARSSGYDLLQVKPAAAGGILECRCQM